MSSDVLGRMVTATRDTAASPVAGLCDAELTAELVALRQLADAAEAAYLTRLRTFETRKLSEAGSALSTRAWIRHHQHVAPAETSRALKIAQGLVDLPVIEAALLAGEIRIPHAAAVVDAARLLGTEVIAGCQDALVKAAKADEPTRLRAALRGMGAAVDNKRAKKRAEKRDQGRWLDVAATFEGAVSIDGVLGPEDGAIVQTAIDALATPSGPDDTRSAAQRRADALVELCRRQLNSASLPTHGGEPVHVTVVCDLATIEARSGGHGELANGTVLRGDAVRRLACDAKISRIIVGPDSQPLDVGRSQRTATPAQRKALRIRDRGCRFPGCDRPIEWTDVHHVVFWAHGGRTDLDQMISLCRTHHTTVHERGWHIQLLGPAQFRFIDPNGIAHQSDPPTTATETIHHILNEQANDNTTQPRAGPQNTDNSNTEQTHDDGENQTADRHGVNGRGEAHGTADAA